MCRPHGFGPIGTDRGISSLRTSKEACTDTGTPEEIAVMLTLSTSIYAESTIS